VKFTKETFAEQVKDALLHLYDVAYLPQLELTHIFAKDETPTWQERARNLRRTLIRAIESLDPGSHLSPRARERRSYIVLYNRYVRSMQTWEVMEELAISERHYWREHKKAFDALVGLLWDQYCRQGEEQVMSTSGEKRVVAQTEADLMASHSNPEEVDIAEVLHQIVWALQTMIQSKGIRLMTDIPDTLVLAFVDRAIMRQICLNLLSYASDATSDGVVSVLIRDQSGKVQLRLETSIQPGSGTLAERADLRLDIVRRLVESQDGHMYIQAEESGCWSATASFPTAQRKPILVIDDNSAIIRLFERYLTGSKCRVVGARTGQEALQLANEVKPAAITLDVMMPSQDGWEILQALKAKPELQDTPVIICSILDEPDRAYSLGADDFIRKPVSQATLRRTLDHWLVDANRS
jgi:CheY-like chemotaxis protein